jgi:hypothetical protein
MTLITLTGGGAGLTDSWWDRFDVPVESWPEDSNRSSVVENLGSPSDAQLPPYDQRLRGELYLRFGKLQPLPDAISYDSMPSTLGSTPALADVNNDGLADLLAATAQGTLLVYPGLTAGTFDRPQSFALETKDPRAIVVSDFDSNGRLDVVITGADRVEVFYNDGMGNLSSLAQLPDITSPTALVAEDLNRDGSPELVVAETEGLTVLRRQRLTNWNDDGRGIDLWNSALRMMNGEWEKSALSVHDSSFSVHRSPRLMALAVADLNGDDRSDLAMVDAAGRLTILSTDERGAFFQRRWVGLGGSWSVVNGSWFLAAADMNDDRLNDVIVSDGRLVTVLLNQEEGRFQQLDPQDFGLTIRSLQAVRLNADAAVDLLLVTSDERLMTVLGDGRGGFNQPVDLEIPGGATHALAARLNHDALTDLVIARPSGGAAVALALAGETFVVTTSCDGSDLNPGDGVCNAGVAICAAVAPAPSTCTLRAAIEEANALAGPQNIYFADNLSGRTIVLVSGFSPLTLTDDGTTIDALTDPDGGPDRPFPPAYVALSGVDAGPNVTGLTISADMCTVRGLAINQFSDSGIVITGSGDVLKSNMIGTDASGSLRCSDKLRGQIA